MRDTEADTCRKYVLPKLYDAGWNDDQISEQKTFTDGRIVVVGAKCYRKNPKRADYLLRYRRDFLIAVVEAKASYKNAGDGLQQAKDYAETLGLNFAYSTNGHGIVEHNYLTGKDRYLATFPAPDELWERIRRAEKITDSKSANRLISPCYHLSGKSPRYYQEIAINRTIQSVLNGKRRILLNMATGTGKTVVVFQIIWKLWNTRWTRTGEDRRPKILYLADRNILIDDPKDKTFSPFGDARWKIEGEAVKSREIYFAIYQAIAKDERRPGLYREYARDFFDLIIVDECHRGSARDESNWREILEYFEPAYQLGITATPLREDNRDTYRYFRNPIYTYSLKQGIEDGFLAPYKVHRVVSSVDATGWRPSKGELDRFGREIPDSEYNTGDFETIVALRARTEAIARHLSEFLKKTDRFGKTIVFCVDQEHAEEMRKALNNLNTDLVKTYPDYVCRVVSEEGDIGRGHLSRFQELETETPAVLTTSKLLTTGVDIPTCKNVVLVKVINSMTDFKQIIGRGTRVRDDYGKLYFTILDYTGSATRLFADPAFDGEPAFITEEEINDQGDVIRKDVSSPPEDDTYPEDTAGYGDSLLSDNRPDKQPRKFYVDNGSVEIVADMVYELGADGKKLRMVKLTDYTGEKVREIFTSSAELRSKWSIAEERAMIIETLSEKGIGLEELIETSGDPGVDPFDLLCSLAFNAPRRSRRERAEKLKKERKDFFEKYGIDARQILDEILDKYIEHGTPQFKIPDILKIDPIARHGNAIEISTKFGGSENLRQALSEMQALLYAA
ncbi:MAG: DEAD/DEAH box helicase family protein [Nitrospirae bacterium]|nr:DEAD/DEAH box helicase family protein [Nitrospirota bacterium]MCL5422720.1 DEAD/DEAH box helicase family protein [Nitrospirota bacterium]